MFSWNTNKQCLLHRKWSCWYCQNLSGTSLLWPLMTSWSTFWDGCRRTAASFIRTTPTPTGFSRRNSSRKTLSGSSLIAPKNLGELFTCVSQPDFLCPGSPSKPQHKDIKISLYSSRFSLYTPSMLSSAAIATAAALGMTTNGGQESDFDINELVRRLQILTRVDYVSFFFSVISLMKNWNNTFSKKNIFL